MNIHIPISQIVHWKKRMQAIFPIRKFTGVSSLFALLIVCAVILTMSLRGNYGNPTPKELLTPKWSSNGPFELSPERGRYALTYSLIEDKSFYFSLPIAAFAVPDVGYTRGHFVSLFAPAVSFLVMPGYVIGKAFGVSQVGSYATITLFALMNAYFIYVIARRLGAGKIAAGIAMLAFLFASPSYAYAVTLYQHHISTFLILLSVYLFLGPNTLLSAGITWLLCAASIPVDYPNLFLMLPIGIATLGKLFPTRLNNKQITATFNLFAPLTFFAALLPLIFFMWFNVNSYGKAFQLAGTVPTGHVIDASGKPVSASSAQPSALTKSTDGGTKNALTYFTPRGLVNGLYILLISPDRGIMYYTPVLLLGVIGAFFIYRKHTSATLLLISIMVCNVLFYGMYGDVWGGWAFGSRYLIPSYALLSVFLAFAFEKKRTRLIIIGVFIILFFYSAAINTAGALSSNANPPQVEVLALEKLSGKIQAYTPIRNLSYLRSDSKSFVYRSALKNHVTAWHYYLFVLGAILVTASILSILLIMEKPRRNI